MNNNFLESLKGSFSKYFSAALFSAVVGMLMNKYYTYAFSVEEYGVLSLYLTFIVYLQSYITFSMDSAWARLYFDFKDKRKKFFSTVINFSLGAVLFWLIVLFLLQDYIIAILGGDIVIYWMSISVVIITAAVKIWNILATLENDASLVRAQTMTQTIINNLVAVIGIQFNIGIASRMLGNITGGIINSYCYIKRLYKKKYIAYGFEFESSIFRKLTPFYLSAFFHTAIIGALSYCDRIMLNSYYGSVQVGIFSLGVLIGQAISLINESCAMALFPAIINNLDSDYKEGIRQLKRVDNIFVLFYFMVFLIVYLLKDVLIIIFSNENYLAAAEIIPLITLGYVSSALYKNVLGVLSFHKIVWRVSILGVVAYIISAVINYLLIPVYAEKGASLALLFGNLIYSFFLHLLARKYYFGIRYIIVRHVGFGILGIMMFLMLIK